MAETILVVDDNPVMRELLQIVLKRKGYRVLCADSSAALVVLANTPVDLIVTDIVMPRMTGVELAQVVHESHPDLPVLYMSGHIEGDSRLPIIHKGEAFLDRLVDSIREVLDARTVTDAGESS